MVFLMALATTSYQKWKKQTKEEELLGSLRGRYVGRYSKTLNIKFTIKGITGHKGESKSKELFKFIEENPFLVGDRIPFKEQLKCKYILNLDGHDYASSIVNTLKSDSLMIGPEPRWDIMINFKLKPWEHYVPTKYDASDLEEKLEWCKSNDEECKNISERATKHISQFTKESEIKIEKRIFEKLKENNKKWL